MTANSLHQTGQAARTRTRPGRSRRAEARVAVLFLLPAILLVLVFRIFPLFWGFGISLTSATSTDPGQFIGAGNYLRALDDPNFRSSMANAVVVLLSVPIFVTIPMLLAILIHQGVPGRTFFRSVYFFPAILSSVIIGSIFSVVLSFNGNLNALLSIAGISGVDWLGHSATALPVTLAIQCWSTFGMGVLIFLAGLSTVSKEMVEAARLDGAKMWQIWWHVIIPELRPIIEFSTVITTIGLLTSMFGLIYVLTGGGPGTATTVPEYLIWAAQGKLNRPAYAAAVSMVLFFMTSILAWLQIRILSRNANI
ncbi:sugar ABC transporter permease [Mesorhizobium sp.]|uniref:carbohydrate ABC transporter permease n=1 Tax=Mesorhizobium sp. TaxID=1871066 RepID=UPI000FE884BA|nr:sugar ABC transporter permease [Mesorhizobium sp.]RWA63097.1 MAG: sugar ABC transporter permease [Mesorhizobium sp.]